jgi:coenzyme F420-reducing hydrogenase delta subunit
MERNHRQTQAQWQEYKKLELLNELEDDLSIYQDRAIAPDSASKNGRSFRKTATELVKRVREGLAAVGDRLTKEPEVKVWQKHDRQWSYLLVCL